MRKLDTKKNKWQLTSHSRAKFLRHERERATVVLALVLFEHNT